MLVNLCAGTASVRLSVCKNLNLKVKRSSFRIYLLFMPGLNVVSFIRPVSGLN